MIQDDTDLDGEEHAAVVLKLTFDQGSGVRFGPHLFLGSVLTDFQTAVGEVDAIGNRLFARYRSWLDREREVHLEMFGPEDGGLVCISKSSGLDWHRPGDGGGIMSDACAQAQSMSADISAMARKSIEDKIGPGAWNGMSEDEQNSAAHTSNQFCLNHLRNTAMRWAAKLEAKLLKPEFEATIREIGPRYRVHGDLSAALRAVSKEFVYLVIRAYAKGNGMYFSAWVIKIFPDRVVFVLKRID